MVGRLSSLRDELQILDEQRRYLASDADEARLQALVSETPLAGRAHRDAARHVEALDRRRREIQDRIAELEVQQDRLLDEFTA